MIRDLIHDTKFFISASQSYMKNERPGLWRSLRAYVRFIRMTQKDRRESK